MPDDQPPEDPERRTAELAKLKAEKEKLDLEKKKIGAELEPRAKNYERGKAELEKLKAEQDKLEAELKPREKNYERGIAELDKLTAEKEKLAAEKVKLESDRKLERWKTAGAVAIGLGVILTFSLGFCTRRDEKDARFRADAAHLVENQPA